MWLLEIFKLYVAHIIFLVDSAAKHPLHMIELWLVNYFAFSILFKLKICKTDNTVFEKKIHIMDFGVQPAMCPCYSTWATNLL